MWYNIFNHILILGRGNTSKFAFINTNLILCQVIIIAMRLLTFLETMYENQIRSTFGPIKLEFCYSDQTNHRRAKTRKSIIAV